MSIHFGQLKGEPTFRNEHPYFGPVRNSIAARLAPDGSEGIIQGTLNTRGIAGESDSFVHSGIKVGDDDQEQDATSVSISGSIPEMLGAAGKVWVIVTTPDERGFDFDTPSSELKAKLEEQAEMRGLSAFRQEELRDALALHEKNVKHFLDTQA